MEWPELLVCVIASRLAFRRADVGDIFSLDRLRLRPLVPAAAAVGAAGAAGAGSVLLLCGLPWWCCLLLGFLCGELIENRWRRWGPD